MMVYYRGGNNLIARIFEVKIDARTGLVLPRRGVSVQSKPDGLEKFGGAYKVSNVPGELKFVQVGRNPDHYEIIPAFAMTFDEYQRLLNQIVLTLA
jgi:hypothetical protein